MPGERGRSRDGNRADFLHDVEYRCTGSAQYRRDLAEVSTWIYKIVQNVAVDHLRARRDHVPVDEAFQLATDGVTAQVESSKISPLGPVPVSTTNPGPLLNCMPATTKV